MTELVEQGSNLPATVEELEQQLAEALGDTPDDKIVEELGVGGRYLPYLSIVQSGSKLSNPPFDLPIGNFALKRNKSVADDLGKEIDIFVCHWRTKAMLMDNSGIKSIFDKDSSEFKEWRRLAESKIDGYAWGFEFLVYLGETGEYATLFCNNPTLRRAATESIMAFTRKFATLEVVVVRDEKHQWKGIHAQRCSTPLSCPLCIEDAAQETDLFKTEVASGQGNEAEDLDASEAVEEEEDR